MCLFTHQWHLIIKFTFKSEIKRLKPPYAFYGQYIDVITTRTIQGFFSLYESHAVSCSYAEICRFFFCHRRKWHRDKIHDDYLSLSKKEKNREKPPTLDRDTSEIFNETPHLLILNLYLIKHCSSIWTYLWESLWWFMIRLMGVGTMWESGIIPLQSQDWSASLSFCVPPILGARPGVHLITSFFFLPILTV